MIKIYTSLTFFFISALVYSQTPWVQKGIDIDGAAAFDQSGNSVSMSLDGNIVAVGSFKNDNVGLGAGEVRVDFLIHSIEE